MNTRTHNPFQKLTLNVKFYVGIDFTLRMKYSSNKSLEITENQIREHCTTNSRSGCRKGQEWKPEVQTNAKDRVRPPQAVAVGHITREKTKFK